MAQFILLLHESPTAFAHVSPDEMQGIIAAYSAWAGGLAQNGRLHGGHKLADEGGRHARKTDGKVLVTDGPFAEAKDVIGGFFIIAAADYAEAAAMITDCPHIDYGWIEIRQVDAMGNDASA